MNQFEPGHRALHAEVQFAVVEVHSEVVVPLVYIVDENSYM